MYERELGDSVLPTSESLGSVCALGARYSSHRTPKSLDPLNGMVDSPGAPFGLVGEERWTAALVSLAELGEDSVEEPGPV